MRFPFCVNAYFLFLARSFRLRELSFCCADAAFVAGSVDFRAIVDLGEDVVSDYCRTHHAGNRGCAHGERAAGRAHVELHVSARIHRDASAALLAVGNGDARLATTRGRRHRRCGQTDKLRELSNPGGDGVFDDHGMHGRARAHRTDADRARAADRAQCAGSIGNHADGIAGAHGHCLAQLGGGLGAADGGQHNAGERRRAARACASYGYIKGSVIGQRRKRDIALLRPQHGTVTGAGNDRLRKQMRIDTAPAAAVALPAVAANMPAINCVSFCA